MSSRIAYNNILESGTVTVTSEATGYPKENAFDWLPFDYWKANAAGTVYLTVDMGANTVVDYWALAFHDLHDHSGTIKPQYSSDNFSADINDLDTVQTPSNGNVIFRPVTQRNVRYYRFEISSTSVASYIGALALGQALTLPGHVPLPFTPPALERKNKILNNFDDLGNFMGSSKVTNGFAFTLEQKIITAAWIDSNWDALADHIEVKPFFYLWDYENRPTEAAFCRANKITYPKRNNPNLYDFAIEGNALIRTTL